MRSSQETTGYGVSLALRATRAYLWRAPKLITDAESIRKASNAQWQRKRSRNILWYQKRKVCTQTAFNAISYFNINTTGLGGP
eukprot:5227038-Pleurochrysis_carterae.AAC.1